MKGLILIDNKNNESRLIYDVMQELGKHGAVFRTNSGNIRLPSGKVFHGLPKGFSDMMFIRNGITYFIETKVKPNKPTPEQLKFLEKMQSLGCRGGVAYSVDEALKLCEIELD